MDIPIFFFASGLSCLTTLFDWFFLLTAEFCASALTLLIIYLLFALTFGPLLSFLRRVPPNFLRIFSPGISCTFPFDIVKVLYQYKC